MLEIESIEIRFFEKIGFLELVKNVKMLFRTYIYFTAIKTVKIFDKKNPTQ